MKTLLELRHEMEEDEHAIEVIKSGIQATKSQLDDGMRQLEERERALSTKAIYMCHIKEIYRLAKYQFARLQNRPNQDLNDTDVLELNKWLARAKNEEGLNTIKKSIAELDKYAPSEIKSSVYALVQKIIIDGPYGQKKT